MTDRSTLLRRHLAEGRMPVRPRDSATVLLLRDGPGGSGVEVFMLRRHRGMAFAPGVYVYPGGAVEAHDQLPEGRFVGPSPVEWACALDTTPVLAASLVSAAIRETFEECGVLLAGPDADSVCSTEGAGWEVRRSSLARGETTLSRLLEEQRLAARTDLLRPLVRWITPTFSVRRYDTRFFAAALPAGARCQDFQEESDTAAWFSVRQALSRYVRGDIPMMLATADALSVIARFATVEQALLAPPPPNIPRIVRGIPDGDDFRFVVDGPDDAVPVDDFLRVHHGVT